MSSYDTWLNVLTGISKGSFDNVYLRDASGNMVDLLTLLAGAGGTVTSATLPLSINSGALSLDLSGFCTSASTPLSLTSGQVTIDLTSYSTTSQMNAAITAALAPYVSLWGFSRPSAPQAAPQVCLFGSSSKGRQKDQSAKRNVSSIGSVLDRPGQVKTLLAFTLPRPTLTTIPTAPPEPPYHR